MKSSKTIKRFIVVGIICTITLSQFAILKYYNNKVSDNIIARMGIGLQGKPGEVDPPILK